MPLSVGEFLNAIINDFIKTLIALANHVENDGGFKLGPLGHARREHGGGSDEPALQGYFLLFGFLL